MKNFWTWVKIIDARIEAKVNALSMCVYLQMAMAFKRLKWNWAKRLESTFARCSLECGNVWAFCVGRSLMFQEELGLDMTIPKIELQEIKEKLIELQEEGTKIFGWR